MFHDVRHITLCLALYGLIAVNFPGGARAESAGTHQTLVQLGEHFLKTDHETGKAALCIDAKDGTLDCHPLTPDEALIWQNIARLEAQNARLIKEIEQLSARTAALEEGQEWIGPEEEKKLEEFMNFSEKALRRFFGLVEELKRGQDETQNL